jgi:uncharacterized protein YecE (DUF72 family)
MRSRVEGGVICEPRHQPWFALEVGELLNKLRIARVAADPALVPGADEVGGWRGLSYHRLHGSPRIYYSAYSSEYLSAVAEALARDDAAGIDTWCIFDNTAGFAATGDALIMKSLMQNQLKHKSPTRRQSALETIVRRDTATSLRNDAHPA